MILGIISIIIGVVWFAVSRWAGNVNYAPQQTVQYLGYVCGSIFIVGGTILCYFGYIKHAFIEIIDKNNKNESTLIGEKFFRNNNNNKYKFIVLQTVDIKKSYGNNYETIISVEEGQIIDYMDQRFENIETNEVWYKVKYRDIEGWCNSNKLKNYYD